MRNGKISHPARFAWELSYGPIPKGTGYHGTTVCHRCDNKLCVNPAHLFLGTQLDNIRDMVRKGRCKRAKLRPSDIATIKAQHKRGTGIKELAKEYGVKASSITSVILGRTWKALEV